MIAPTTPTGSLTTFCQLCVPKALLSAAGAPRKTVDLLGRPEEGFGKGRVELGHVGHHHRGAHFCDQLGAEQLLLGDDGLVELAQAPLAEGPVGRPLRFVEGPPRRGNGPVHVGRRRVRGLAEHLLGGRVDVVEGSSTGRFDERPVDEHVELADRGVGRLGGGHLWFLPFARPCGACALRR